MSPHVKPPHLTVMASEGLQCYLLITATSFALLFSFFHHLYPASIPPPSPAPLPSPWNHPVVENCLGRHHVLNHLSVPAACFTHPEISMVGLTEVRILITASCVSAVPSVPLLFIPLLPMLLCILDAIASSAHGTTLEHMIVAMGHCCRHL